MAPCHKARDAIGSFDGASPPRVLVVHAQDCMDCRDALDHWRAYQTTIAQARGALDAEPDLSPGAWVRIRANVDRQAARGHRPWPRWVGVAAGALVALAAVVAGVHLTGERASRSATALREARAVAPLTVPATSPPLALVSHPRALPPATIAAGQILSAQGTARRVVAFERHILTLAPHTSIVVARWQPDAVVLDLQHGSLRSDVALATPSEIYEVHTPNAVIRVEGTVFTVSTRVGGPTHVAVTHGMVSVTEIGGASTTLRAGQSGDFGAPRSTLAPRARRAQGKDAPRSARPMMPTATHAPRERARRVAPAEHHHGVKVIEIEVPDQFMPRSTHGANALPPAPRPTDRVEPRPRHTHKPLKVIEIDVPPQAQPDIHGH